jgi:hypothetical protein
MTSSVSVLATARSDLAVFPMHSAESCPEGSFPVDLLAGRIEGFLRDLAEAERAGHRCRTYARVVAEVRISLTLTWPGPRPGERRPRE